MAIRRPPTTFSDSITGADLASDIAISTTGNIATTGSGTLTVAGNTTLSGTNNLGSNPTLTLGTNTTFPSGHIIQCQFVHMTGSFAHSNNTLTQVTDGSNPLLKAITPIKASSKILVMLSCSMAGGESHTQGYLQLQRKVASGSYGVIGGGSDLGSNRNPALGQVSTTRVEATNQIGYHFFDSPSYSVGDEITYRVMGAGQQGGYYVYVGRARQSGDANYVSRMPSTLTLLEIAN